MLVAAVSVPGSPALVPAVSTGAAADLAQARAAAMAATNWLHAQRLDLLVLVGEGGVAPRWWEAGSPVGFHGLGVPLGGRLGQEMTSSCAPVAAGDRLPLSLAVGAWLLGPARMVLRALAVPPSLPLADCLALGSALAGAGDRVGLLVVGDGSARRSEKAPGHLDPRAGAMDEGIARALASVDTAALCALDAELCAELMVAGRAPWQVLAGAVEWGQQGWSGTVEEVSAPLGVGLFVARLTVLSQA